MQGHRLDTHQGVPTQLDICFACQGLWFDPQESLRLSAAAVTQLFELLHRHRDDAHTPMGTRLSCPQCRRGLVHGFDVVKRGRYITYRCPQRHGRFASFSSFFIEKGFVRMMTRPEIEDLARRVAAIHCTGCGAPVDIRRDHACPHCRAAFSLLDPQAVALALKQHAQDAADTRRGPRAPASAKIDIGDALVAIERDRQRALREEEQGRRIETLDLWALGVELVWRALSR